MMSNMSNIYDEALTIMSNIYDGALTIMPNIYDGALTILNPWWAHVRVRIRWYEIIVFWNILCTY